MDKLTYDLINTYQFDYISTRHRTDLKDCGCCSMVEEMNEIRQLYKKKGNIDDVLKHWKMSPLFKKTESMKVLLISKSFTTLFIP